MQLMMASTRSIIFFADGSEETQSGLRRLLHTHPGGSLLSRFLGEVTSALRQEFRYVHPVDRDGLPALENLHELVNDPFDESVRHPALHPTEIVLVHLGHFIATYEDSPHEPYPSASDSIIVGVCFGELSATAVSVAKSLVELIPLAVETVCIAFRAGILAASVGNSLERRTLPAKCWSATVPCKCGLDDEAQLEALGEHLTIPRHHRPYVTAFSRNNLTLGGPPSSLRRIFDHFDQRGLDDISRRWRDVRIYAPYHASRLFSLAHAAQLVERRVGRSASGFNKDPWQLQPRILIGSATGMPYRPTSRRQLIETVVYNILAQPIRWEDVIAGCKMTLDNFDASKWAVRTFGQSLLARKFSVALQSAADIHISLDEVFGVQRSQPPRARQFPIAVVGMAGRFPKADNIEAFWDILKSGTDCHEPVPLHRFDAGTHLSKPAYGCFLEKPGDFDARFFNMSPREALETDPGQRLALVTAYEALESSGFVPNRTPSTRLDRVGTFNGQVTDEYKEQNMAQEVGTYFIPGSMRAFATGRINHFFKFGGPAYSFDTACSTSSVALHVACNSIWSNECETAIVGGMNIISSSDNYHGLQAGHFISPTGGCKTWDRDADGYCRGEAVASVVLKSLDAAQADNDNVLAVILSVATNYSAEADSITRPHGPTQERLYKTVLQDAGLHPFDIQYIEMHGTATQAGDVVEMGSVSRVFAPTLPQRPAANPLYVGSVKANVGHGESASGITGLIKSLLIFQEQRLPPHIGIKTSINPKLPDLHPRNIRIPDKAIPLPSANAQGSRRRILLNNFSAAGGNSTCVLEEPPAPRIDETCVDTRSHHIILMSAKSPSALMRNCQNLMSFLQTRPDTSLSHLSYTTTVRRIRHPLRKAFLVASVRQLENELVSLLSTSASMGPSLETKVSRACFCFSGQGSFYSPIAKDLFNSNRQFRSDILSFNNLSENLGLGAFLSIIDGSGSSLNGSEVQVHLAFVALQMALFRFFRSLGIVPSLVLGHSLGEFAALYASGVLSASDTLYLVGHRARLLEDLCQPFAHSMLAVHTDLSTIKQILEEQTHEVEVACVNGPSDVVLSACIDVCEELKSEFKSKGIACRLLKTAYGYHSSQIDPMLRPFEEIAASVEFQKPKVTVASPSTCSIIREANVVCPSYIRDQSRNRVRFYETLRECERDGVVDAASVWIEIGPRPTCSNMVRATLGSQSRVLPSLREGEDAWTTICQSVCFLHQSGLDVDWQFYHRDFEAGQRLLNLPLYAWDQQEYWIPYESDWLLNKVGRSKTLASDQPLQRGPRTTSVQRLVTRELQDKKILLVFETDILEPNIKEIVSGHRVHGCELCPASVYVDIALTIADHVRKHEAPQYLSSGISIHSMEIIHPITLSGALNQGRRLLRIKADADLVADSLSLDIVLCSQQSKTGKSSAKCTVRFENSSNWVSKWSRSSYLIRNRMTSLAQGALEGKTQEILRSTVYQLFSSVVEYDRGYQSIDKVHLNNDDFEAVATLSLQQVKNAGTFFCNPFWLDGLLHISGFIMNANVKLDLKNVFFISNGWDSFRLARPLSSANVYQVYVKMHRLHERQYAGDVCIFHEGSQIGKVKGLKFQQVPGSFFNEIPPSLSPKQHHNSMTAYESHRVAKIQLPTDGPLNVQSVMENPNKGGDVLSLIAEETRIPVYELSPASEFASLGVDSLLSLSIASKMRECFQLDLPYSIFEDFRTIGDLQNHCSKFLANGINHEESELFSTEPNSTSKNGEALPVSVVSRDTDDTEKALPQPSQLPISVVLQGTIKPNQQTLFLFPDGSGSAVSYAKFPQLLPGLCVVGLNSPFLGAGRNVSFAVDDLVKHWIVEIRALCKSGPYILGGWSAGGYYAFEAAKTLIHAGEAVNKVILIDTPPRNCYESIPLGVLHYLSEHKIIGSGMNKVPPLWLTDHFEATICAIDAYTPAPLEGNCQPQVFVIWASDRVESQSRKGSDFDMKISRFLLDRQIDDGLRGWAALFPECQIRVSRAPGSHFSMVSNPNDSELSRLIAAAISDHQATQLFTKVDSFDSIEDGGSL